VVANNTGQTFCPNPTYSMTADVDINAPEAWDIFTGNNPQVRVGIIDTGIDIGHPDLTHVDPGFPTTTLRT
jgi:hypothetical protein